MANEFVEVNLESPIEYGSSYRETFVVDVTETSSSNEFRVLKVPIPQRYFSVSMNIDNAKFVTDVMDIFQVVYGRYAGFRYKCWDDYSTHADGLSAPTAFDHTCTLLSAGVYQLTKEYGLSKTALGTIGRPRRNLFKPVTGTTRVSVAGVEVLNTPAVNWSVSTVTGQVTFTNKSSTVSGVITKTSQAVVPCAGHTFVVGESVVFASCVGMTQINGLRGLITAVSSGVSITVNINSTSFGTWTSGGTINTRPSGTEVVKAGCLFDYPVRFNSDMNVTQENYSNRLLDSIALKELISL